MIDKEVLCRVLEVALNKGGDYADVYCESRLSFLAQLEDGKLDKLHKGVDAGVGIRVIFNGKTSYGYSNRLDEKSLIELAALVGKASTGNPKSLAADLTVSKPAVNFIIAVPPENVPTGKKISLVRNADSVARSYNNKIKQVLAVYRDTLKQVRIATSDGTITDDERIYTLALVQVVAAENGTIQTGYEPLGGLIGFEIFDKNPIEELAEQAAKRAVMMLRAPKAPAGRMPVVIGAEAGGTMIHEAIGHGLEADLADQGLSVYSGKMGRRVASKLITVIDDATIQGKRGSFRFDDEGVPSQKTILVDRGILVNYLYDRLNALKGGKTSTGNGRRESYRHRPIPRMTNTFIAPGTHNPDDIIKSVNKGLYVKKMGGGQVNTINGDFVFDVQEGYLIEGGKISEPVRGATLTGNGPQILNSIDMVGTDLGFSIGTCGKDAQGVPVSDAMPTVRIPEIVIGGSVKD